MKNAEQLKCELEKLANQVEDIQQTLVSEYACLGICELNQAIARLR